jgi:hypothetical protein
MYRLEDVIELFEQFDEIVEVFFVKVLTYWVSTDYPVAVHFDDGVHDFFFPLPAQPEETMNAGSNNRADP